MSKKLKKIHKKEFNQIPKTIQLLFYMKWISSTYFAIYRIILGTYLTIHFVQLLPSSEELFSNQGVISNTTLLPAYEKLSSTIFLLSHDDPNTVTLFLYSLIICSILFTMGYYRKICSLWLFYGWMSLLNRNPLISNPGLAYIGWLLLACVCVPSGDRLGFLLFESERKKEYDKNDRWEVPNPIYYGFWIVVGISYTASGIHKLQCPSWLDGTALYYVLSGPLARNNFIVGLLLQYDFIIKIMSWSSLFLEISYLFIGTFYRTRKIYWFLSMGFHLGILFTINFGDLTMGMIMVHLFTFDPSWFEFSKRIVRKYDWNGHETIDVDINHSDNFNSKPLVKSIGEFMKDVQNDAQNKQNKQNKWNDAQNKRNNSLNLPYSTFLVYFIYATLTILITLVINHKQTILSSMTRIAELTMDMYWGFSTLIVILAILMVLERLYPDVKLEYVPGWWKWVVIINAFQLFAVIIATFTWETWLQNTKYFMDETEFHLKKHVSPFMGGLIAYLINQWLFYHWHKAKHEIYILWILCHQFHHSPSRIETITSFYKHPLEIIIDSQIMAILLYSVLGLTPESSIWLSIFSGIGEYIYHMNIKTPKILGYFFQRPESHRCHHRRNKREHCPNYSDIPPWDILGGTFENPETMDKPTGFSPHWENKRLDIMMFRNVILSNIRRSSKSIFHDFKTFKNSIRRYICYGLVIWGTLNSLGFLVHSSAMRDIGFVSVSSPLPMVFSHYNGIETFSTNFEIEVEYLNGSIVKMNLDSEKYSLLGGAYNRRNVYGVLFSHGPFFSNEKLVRIRDSVLNYAFCSPGVIADEFGMSEGEGESESEAINRVQIIVWHRTNWKIGKLDVKCDIK